MSSFTSSSKICQEFESIYTTDPKKRRYNVFLSFCAHDKGYFLSSLEEALSLEAGIDVFGVIKRFQHGERAESVLNVIQDCKVAVVLFSKNYTDSSSCIQELEKITQCCRTSDLVVLPVFYHGVGSFYDGDMFGGDTFHDFLDRISMKEISKEEDKLMTWVAVITKANKYLGSRDLIYRPVYRYEHVPTKDYIKDIVEHVTCVINKNRDFCANSCTPSVKAGVQDVIQLLKQSKSPLIIGIWGMTGIGKSTIAQAIYDQIGLYFEHKSFLKDIGGVWGKYNAHQISSHSLQHQRVLLVLDNIDKLEQLNALCPRSRKWFGKGSKIIITTRDRHILKVHKVDHIYRVKELDESESLEVFNWGAFGQAKSPAKDFVELSRLVVAYSGGLPLALKELGMFLHGKEVLHWKGVLRSLQRFSIPAPQLLEALEKSFNDLSDKEKQKFLDIACSFDNVNQNYVLQISLSRLQDKGFLTIDENKKLGMHVLLQAMARDIIKRKSSNNTDQPKRYDVFLSFRGEDNRAKFMSHLNSSLQNAGIYVFKDDDEIERGDHISVSLLRAIGQSRIAIVVLSTNYANSKWCMLELEKIMEIGRNRGLVVVPVFYEVAPSEVRHLEGQFGKAFDDLISTNSVNESTKTNWKRELFDVGSTAGFVLIDSRNESADIKNIVEHVTRLLDRTELFVAEHPVGLESRVEAATKLLNIQKSDVLILGIWGMGGMGKTTLAKAIYNQIGSKFEGRSFLLNIREVWETDTNHVSLQQQILCDVYKTTAFKIPDIESGKNMLKEKLSQSRILLVLDDVNELEQLKALCGSREWFGPGSRIIITTRDMHLLRLCGVYQMYTIEEMDKTESLKLFSWHAFKQPSPIKDYATHSTDVIAYSGGLPLALEVLGSYLSDCEISEWHKVLEKLKRIPHDQVQEKLKVSFHGLKDFTEKQIFLDIACFFIGMDKKDVIQILNGCGFFADVGIKVLVERALVTIDNRNKLRMHDLLRDMGRQIIYEEAPSDPEKRSRLWRHEEVFDILEKLKGTEAVTGLALEFPRKDCLQTKAFKKMNKLRLLRLARVKLNGDFKYLSRDLKWLYWHGFAETCIPTEFLQGSLVAVELKYSKLKQLWNKSQMLENLKILNLSHSLDLTETPNFSCLPNLEKLVLENCPSLSTVSQSIGSLDKLLLINLRDCTGLRKLPRSIYKLKSLETLILSGCSMIEELEEDVEQMESLINLIADKTAITKVPFSIVRMKSIGYISLSGFEGFSRDVFPSLIRSWMSPSNNVISLVQTSVSMSSLGTSNDLQKLQILCVECGSDLQLTQYIARSFDVLRATSYQKFKASASSIPSEISDMYASPLIDDFLCKVRTSGSMNHLKTLLIQMGTKCQVSDIAVDNVLQTADETWDLFFLPCDNNSEWSSFSCKGCSIIFDIPTIKGQNLKSMILFVVYYSSSENITSEGCHGVLIINYTKKTIQIYKRDTLTSFGHEDWQRITSNLEPGNKVEVMVVFGEGFIVDKITVSLLYGEPVNKEMDVIVFGNDDNSGRVSGGDNEVINVFGEGTVNHSQITRPTNVWYADVIELVQPVPYDPDQSAEEVAEVICAAEAEGDQEQQVPLPEGQCELQAATTPETIGLVLGGRILDTPEKLRADFVRLQQTVTAVEVKLVDSYTQSRSEEIEALTATTLKPTTEIPQPKPASVTIPEATQAIPTKSLSSDQNTKQVIVRNVESNYAFDTEMIFVSAPSSSEPTFIPTPPALHPDLEGISVIIYNRVKELFSERLTSISPQSYAAKWDRLRDSVNQALERLKTISSSVVEQNLANWLDNVRKHMDRVDLRRNIFRQIEPPRVPLIDDLPEFRGLASYNELFALKLEEIFVKREIYEAPTLKVLKEELASQRLKQEALEDKLESLAANQEEIQNTQRGMQTQLDNVIQGQIEMKAMQDEMSRDIKTLLQLLSHKP